MVSCFEVMDEVDQKYKLSFSELVRKAPREYHDLGIGKGKSIYKILKMLRILLICSESVSEKGSLDKF